jgi:acetyl-CoA acyltransferase
MPASRSGYDVAALQFGQYCALSGTGLAGLGQFLFPGRSTSKVIEAYICDYVRTPIGRYGGGLSSVRTDDLAAIPIRALKDRNACADWDMLDEVYIGCANQAGEDNRNVARMAVLLAGLPVTVPGTTINRLCGSGMDAVLMAARAIKAGEIDFAIAGGVESMSRAPFVLPKADTAFSRSGTIFDTTIGWRFINNRMQELYGTESMPETAENVAVDFNISREDQDRFAMNSQMKAGRAQENGRLGREIIAISIPQRRGAPLLLEKDEHPRPGVTLEELTQLPALFRKPGTVTAGNASGVNDGAAAMIVASSAGVKRHGLTPIARITSGATAGVAPRIMGYGPVPAIQKLCKQAKIAADEIEILELNEAFASQALASLRALGFEDCEDRVNPNGGAIALGHPLGMSGTRIAGTAALELKDRNAKFAVAAMCIGVGQGIAVLIAAA